jgi:hypothetical protein
MDRTASISELPEVLASALRFLDEHLYHEEISRSLGIEVEAVGSLLRQTAQAVFPLSGSLSRCHAHRPCAFIGMRGVRQAIRAIEMSLVTCRIARQRPKFGTRCRCICWWVSNVSCSVQHIRTHK